MPYGFCRENIEFGKSKYGARKIWEMPEMFTPCSKNATTRLLAGNQSCLKSNASFER